MQNLLEIEFRNTLKTLMQNKTCTTDCYTIDKIPFDDFAHQLFCAYLKHFNNMNVHYARMLKLDARFLHFYQDTEHYYVKLDGAGVGKLNLELTQVDLCGVFEADVTPQLYLV